MRRPSGGGHSCPFTLKPQKPRFFPPTCLGPLAPGSVTGKEDGWGPSLKTKSDNCDGPWRSRPFLPPPLPHFSPFRLMSGLPESQRETGVVGRGWVRICEYRATSTVYLPFYYIISTDTPKEPRFLAVRPASKATGRGRRGRVYYHIGSRQRARQGFFYSSFLFLRLPLPPSGWVRYQNVVSLSRLSARGAPR